MRPRKRPGRSAAVLLVLGCGVALFHRALFLNETFVNRDLRAYYRAAKSLLLPLVKASGGIPLWNPFFASGQPFAANPEHEVFHPATTLFFVLPFEWAFRLEIILPPIAAAFGMLFLLRTLERSRAASLFGALTWGFGGYVLSTTNLLPCLLATMPLPFVLAFTVRTLRGEGLPAVAGLAVSFSFVGLAAEPSTLLAFPLLGIAALLHGLLEAPRPIRSGRVLRNTVAAYLLGTALAAAALVPAVALSRKTSRAQGLDEALATQWSTPPLRLIEILFPHALGHAEAENEAWFWAAALYPGRRFPFYISFYAGLLAGVLGAFAFWRCRRTLWPWGLAAVGGFLLAFGGNSPFFHLARGLLPALRQVRSPEKFILPALLAWAVAAAFGFDAILFGRRDESKRVRTALLAVSTLAGAAAVLALLADLQRQGTVWVAVGAPAAIARDLSRTVALDCALVSLWALLYAWFLPRAGAYRRRAVAFLPLLAAADLVAAGFPLLRTSPVEKERTPPQFLQDFLAVRPAGPLFHLAAWTARGHVPSNLLAAPPMPSFWGVATVLESDFDLTELTWSADATARFWEAVNKQPRLLPGLLARRGVAAVVRERPGPPFLEVLFPAARRPFASCVAGIEHADGGAGWVEAVRRLGPDALARSALVDRAQTGLPAALSPCTATVRRQTPVQILLDVAGDGPQPSFVVLNQTWDTGWSATLDGDPVPVSRTDLSLCGIITPPGSHRLEMRYDDPAVRCGVRISLAAAAATGILGLAMAWRVFHDRPNP